MRSTELLILKGPNQLISSEERLEGFLKAVEGKNIKIHVVDSPYELHDAENITLNFCRNILASMEFLGAAMFRRLVR